MTILSSRPYWFSPRTMAAAAAACLFGSEAHADVLEIGPSGAVWVAGGPVEPAQPRPAERRAQPTSRNTGGAVPSQVPPQWRPHVAYLAQKYDVSPALIEAVVWQESRWNPNAVSSAGARGLAQLMPGTARELGVNAFDPYANLEGGVKYLRQQLDAFNGDLEKALAAYNAGPHRVRRAGGVPNIRETRLYVASIMARLANPSRR